MPDILSLPGSRFQEHRFLLAPNTLTWRSPLTKAAQTQIRTGARWMATYRLPPMLRADAEVWCAFLARLNGMGGRFYAYDPAGRMPRGSAAGTPLVYGADQLGTMLVTYGWTPGEAGVLRIGDYISYATPSGWRQLHKIVEEPEVVSGGFGTPGWGEGGYDLPSGGLALTIAPPIRESPAADAPITTTVATCVMMLVDDEQAAWNVSTAQHFGMEFSGEEVYA